MAQIDVLLPVFNAERTVRSAVASVLRQSFRDLRIVAVDDGSTDGTSEILAELATTDSRLMIIRTQNGGIVDALNTGLRHCEAPMIARQDADDNSFPDRLESQFRYLTNNPDCVAVSGNAVHIDEGGVRIGSTRWHGDAQGNPNSVPARDPHLLHPFLMTRLNCVRKAGGYRHVLHAEDVDLYWRLEPLGRLHTLEAQLGEYRIHQHSLTSGSIECIRAAALFSQLAAISAKRRAMGTPDIEFSRRYQDEISAAASLAEMVTIAEEKLAGREREYLEVRTAAHMIQQRIFRKFHFQRSDAVTIAKFLWEHRNEIKGRDRLTLMQAPFWYYYKPRAYLAALRRLFASMPEP